MEEDQFYHKKGDLKHWQFKSMNDTVATFEHMPLFPPKDGQPVKLEVELNQLKVVKKAATATKIAAEPRSARPLARNPADFQPREYEGRSHACHDQPVQ